MIPATQRTNNLPGYALDITPWTTETQIWIKMTAYTPVLPTNSVFEMYVSVLDPYDTAYDTVKCSMEYWGNEQANTVDEFEVNDYRGSVPLHEETTVGDSISSVASLLDTAKGGTSDWWLSPFADDSKIECTDSYCDVTCVVYRTQSTADK